MRKKHLDFNPYMDGAEREELKKEGWNQLDKATNIVDAVNAYTKVITAYHERSCDVLYQDNQQCPTFDEYTAHYVRSSLMRNLETNYTASYSITKELVCCIELEKKYPFPNNCKLMIKPGGSYWHKKFAKTVVHRPLGPDFKLPNNLPYYN